MTSIVAWCSSYSLLHTHFAFIYNRLVGLFRFEEWMIYWLINSFIILRDAYSIMIVSFMIAIVTSIGNYLKHTMNSQNGKCPLLQNKRQTRNQVHGLKIKYPGLGFWENKTQKVGPIFLKNMLSCQFNRLIFIQIMAFPGRWLNNWTPLSFSPFKNINAFPS